MSALVETSKRHIVVLGGGGFSMEPRNRLLDDFVLGLSRRRRPRVCFIPTASGDNQGYIDRFYRAYKSPRARPNHLALFSRGATQPRDLHSQDVIYVGGGNTANLLAIWRVHGVDKILRSAWQRGVVLAGVSAGMLCWFECGVTDSFGGLAALRDGLGLLPGSACPHYDGEARRRPTYHKLIRDGMPGGFAADDGAALHFVGRSLAECVSSRPKARAYRVDRSGASVRETVLPTRYLRLV